MLAPAAIKAVKKWRYRPYRVDGRAIELDTTIEVKFELDEPLSALREGTLRGKLELCLYRLP